MRTRSEEIDRQDRRAGGSGADMPRSMRYAITVLLAAIVAGALYLLAVRGDALLSDLAAVAALICG